MAVSRVSDHIWKDMDAMELFKSAGLYEDDKRTGKRASISLAFCCLEKMKLSVHALLASCPMYFFAETM